MGDIVKARDGLKRRLQNSAENGLFDNKAEYADGAYTNVSESSINNPAQMVAKVAESLVDYLLPTTQLGKDVAGAKGAPERATVTTKGSSKTGKDTSTPEGFVESIDLVAKDSKKSSDKDKGGIPVFFPIASKNYTSLRINLMT